MGYFSWSHPRGTFTEYESPRGGSPDLRIQLGVLKNVLEWFDFAAMQPNSEVLRKGPKPLVAWALVEEGQQYAVYLHTRLSWKPKSEDLEPGSEREVLFKLKIPAGIYVAEWISPTSGEILKRETLQHEQGLLSVGA